LLRLVPRLALIGTCAFGVSALVAGTAEAAQNNYVTQPAVTGVSALTPESAVVSGAVDTGGDPGVNFAASAASPLSFGGLTINACILPTVPPSGTTCQLNGIPVGLGYYSTALFEADPLSDYIASGNQPGQDTTIAQVVEVPTTTGLSAVSAELGSYPAGNAFGSSALTPGTKYVYWLVQQAGETDQATTVNEYSSADLDAWIKGTALSGVGFGKPSGAASLTAWGGGADPNDPTQVPADLINPDYACVLNTTIAGVTTNTWTAELAAGQVPVSADATATIGGTALPYGINSVSASGTFTATAKQEPAEQGPCVTFYGGNGTNFYTSPTGEFTTPPLGKILVARKGAVVGRRAVLAISDRSVESAAGTIVLTNRKGVKVASGKFSVPAGATGAASLKLTGAGAALLRKGALVTKVNLTSTTDQPSPSKLVTLH
jgi:hypothetical protein